MRVCGTRNTLRVDYHSRTVTLEADALLPSAVGRLVRGERPVPLSYRDILRVSGLMDRSFQQLEQRRAA
jgi:hypothetical protein